jgi:elongation factor P
MPKACELKKGDVIEKDGKLFIVRQIDVKSPSSRGAQTLYKIRFSRIPDSQKMDLSLAGDDILQGADLRRSVAQLLYKEGDLYTFMEQDDYSQHSLNADEIEPVLPYLYEGIEGLTALIVDDRVVSIELPASISLPITETSPSIKGTSASARTKTAMVETGLELQVPEYLAEGEVIKINTATGKYISRA